MKQAKIGTLKVQPTKNSRTGETSWSVLRLDGYLELFPGVVSDTWSMVKSGFTSKTDASKWVKSQH